MVDGKQISVLGMHGEISVVLISHVTEASETMRILAAPYADPFVLLVRQ